MLKKYSKVINKCISKVPICMFFMICIFTILSFRLPYIMLLNIDFCLMFIYLLITLLHFSLTETNLYLEKIIEMWKVYFFLISLMIIMLFTVTMNMSNLEFDLYKTKIIYESKTNLEDANITYHKYESAVYKMRDVFFGDITTVKSEQPTKNIKPQRVFMNNLFTGILGIISLFMFLWYFKHFSPLLKEYFNKNSD